MKYLQTKKQRGWFVFAMLCAVIEMAVGVFCGWDQVGCFDIFIGAGAAIIFAVFEIVVWIELGDDE